ncbi:carboxymethylenebutenolidase homolog [Prunus yedoensis var. nudiflora]|uniref:Carboxymethylenebutenolidase homolog n=1 Tax=Prunus yedoensis var. nudiflora TaxID=2094558 RepID=A0A314UYM4_PRUYE|nr:carboxymethylenebutenolidase homolog [Prunus yedoensis var. nudiflora]
MGLYSTGSGAGNPLSSASMSTTPRHLLLRKPTPRHHQLGFLSTFAFPLLHTSSGSRACNSSCQRSSTENIGRKITCSLLKVEDDVNDESCELVSGVELSVGEGADSINAHLFKAVKNNNGTGILLLSDIFGFEDPSTREFAYRVACNGYNVLLPDLFRGDPWTKDRLEDRPKNLFDKWISEQEPQRVAKDIATSAKWMVDEFLAAGISKKLGLIGFCFGGGRVIEVLAKDQGAYFGIGVSFYGTRIDTSVASKLRVVVFKGRGHGFAHRPQSFEEDEDAEQAFMMMRNWLNDGLVANTC